MDDTDVLKILKHAPEELWKFLYDCGMRKVLDIEGKYSLYMTSGEKINTDRNGINHLLSSKRNTIQAELINIKKKKTFKGMHSVLRRGSSWVMDSSGHRFVHKPRYDYPEETKKRITELNNELKILNEWQDDIEKLFNLLQAGSFNIPDIYQARKSNVAISKSENQQVEETVPMSEYQNVNRMLKVTQDKVIILKRKIRSKDISRDDIWNYADKCRKKNRSINYSALGKSLGITYHTAKKWCKERGIE